MSNLERKLINIGSSIILGFNLLFNIPEVEANDHGNVSIKRAKSYYEYILTRRHYLKHSEIIEGRKLNEEIRIKIKEAIIINYNIVLKLDRGSSYLWGEIGEVLMDFERYKEAEYYLRKALKLDRDNKKAYNELINLYKIKDKPDEIEALEAGYGYRFIEDEKNINKER
ncbi:hypothetical protein HYX17_04475 [Candidatus Woesearchaeota archaeon]|nr:hypothetical protein [Candidatus Woesearchaeota archaeon]